jgi:tRNA dimethylallyltransferase
MLNHLENIPNDQPVLIAGATGSGKSALALALARTGGGAIVNADALQVYDCWRVLTARPSEADLAAAPHLLYGHVGAEQHYSVGHWLREVAPLLRAGPRPIIVGGTGLYFSALTEGLAEIPPTPAEVRAEADARVASGGVPQMLAALDPATRARIDILNPVRIQRAWEVQQATGRGLAAWQDDTGPPLLALPEAVALVIDAPPGWLNPRLERRFDAMLADGALDEARANLPGWDPRRPSAKAIGGPELVSHLQGKSSLDEARRLALISSRRYAKRQRSWFRSRMQDWRWIAPPDRGSGP